MADQEGQQSGLMFSQAETRGGLPCDPFSDHTVIFTLSLSQIVEQHGEVQHFFVFDFLIGLTEHARRHAQCFGLA